MIQTCLKNHIAKGGGGDCYIASKTYFYNAKKGVKNGLRSVKKQASGWTTFEQHKQTRSLYEERATRPGTLSAMLLQN
jgi:hypothetical protein